MKTFYTFLLLAGCLLCAVNGARRSDESEEDFYRRCTNFDHRVPFNRDPKPVPAPPPASFGPLFQNVTTHVAVVVGNQAELQYHQAALAATTIDFYGWLPVVQLRNVTGTYCGRTIILNINVYLTTSRLFDGGEGFQEIFELIDDGPNWWRDWYRQHGPSQVYGGFLISDNSQGQPVITGPELLQFFADQGAELVMHMNTPPKDAYFFKVGYGYHEVVLPSVATSRRVVKS